MTIIERSLRSASFFALGRSEVNRKTKDATRFQPVKAPKRGGVFPFMAKNKGADCPPSSGVYPESRPETYIRKKISNL
jgi:hypothetical protein